MTDRPSSATATEVVAAIVRGSFPVLLFDKRVTLPAATSALRELETFVGGDDIRFGDLLDTPVVDGQEVQILPAVAGG